MLKINPLRKPVALWLYSSCILIFSTFQISHAIPPFSMPRFAQLDAAYNSFSKQTTAKRDEILNKVIGLSQNLRQPKHQNSGNETLDFLNRIDSDNEEALRMLNELAIGDEKKWKFVAERQGIRVHRRNVKAGKFVKRSDLMRGAKHACVKSTGIVDASAEAVFNLFIDNSRVQEYNEHCAEVQDVKYFPGSSNSAWSKVAWARSPNYGVFRPRDFFSVVHYRKHNDGSYSIMNRPAYLESHPPSKQYVRATIMLAGNFIKPLPDGRSHITLIAHVNPGGGADTPLAARLINGFCAAGPPTFIRRLEAAAKLKKKHS